jgi:hypothetical protein
MKMTTDERKDIAKLMKLQNEFVKEAKYELQLFNIKEQHELKLKHMQARVTELEENLFLKVLKVLKCINLQELYIKKLQLDIHDKQKTIDILARSNSIAPTNDEITSNWLALQKLFTTAHL